MEKSRMEATRILINWQTSKELLDDIKLSKEQIHKNSTDIENYIKLLNTLIEDNKYYEERMKMAKKEYERREGGKDNA